MQPPFLPQFIDPTRSLTRYSVQFSLVLGGATFMSMMTDVSRIERVVRLSLPTIARYHVPWLTPVG